MNFKLDISTKWGQEGREVKKSENFADMIYVWPLSEQQCNFRVYVKLPYTRSPCGARSLIPLPTYLQKQFTLLSKFTS